MKTIQAQEKVSQDAIGTLSDTVKAAGENIGSAVQSWSEGLQNSFSKLFKDLETSSATGYATVRFCVSFSLHVLMHFAF